MVFSSHAFLVFMLVLLAVYAGVTRWAPQHAKLTLVLASLLFYGWTMPVFLVLLGLSLAFNYVVSMGLDGREQTTRKRWLLWIGVGTNLSLIAYYKYFNLLLSGLNVAAGLSLPMQDILLPIGISFFTFQQIAYLVDVAEGKTTRASVLDYVFIIVFFPHLIAGPVVLQEHLLPQVREKTEKAAWSLKADHVALGLALFSMGLFKKTVLADNVGRYADFLFSAAHRGDAIGTLDAWMGTIAYSFQIYFDFSGYSDMAVGLAFLFGFRLPMNFFSPYKAHNIIEFWRRWHISLSSFLRDYLYIRLGGSRHGFARTMAALMATMLLGGLWHGAGLQYLVWGGLHGLYLVLNHTWRRIHRRVGRAPALVAPCLWRGADLRRSLRGLGLLPGHGRERGQPHRGGDVRLRRARVVHAHLARHRHLRVGVLLDRLVRAQHGAAVRPARDVLAQPRLAARGGRVQARPGLRLYPPLGLGHRLDLHGRLVRHQQPQPLPLLPVLRG